MINLFFTNDPPIELLKKSREISPPSGVSKFCRLRLTQASLSKFTLLINKQILMERRVQIGTVNESFYEFFY